VGDLGHPPKEGRRWTRWVLNAGLILLSVALGLAGLEIALHFTSYRYLLTRDRHLRFYYRADLSRGFDIAPRVRGKRMSVDRRVEFDIWSNGLGCFDTPYRDEKNFILLMGDSFTHSYAPFPDKWGTQVEKLLGYRVLKCGVTGYGTKEELIKAKEIIARIGAKPRLIILGYFWNDLGDDYSFPRLTVIDGFLVESTKYKDPKTNQLSKAKVEKHYTWWDKWFGGTYPLSRGEMIRYYLERRLIIVNLINDAWLRLFPLKNKTGANPERFLAFQPEQPWSRKVWKRHLENLKAFKDLAAANGARLLVVLIPTNTQVYPFLSARRDVDLTRPNRKVEQYLRRRGIDYLDLLPLMRAYADETPRAALDPDRDLYWQHNSHWSIRGEHLAGLLVAWYILEHNLVEVGDREARLQTVEAKLKDWRRRGQAP
jgi:hypothetical protein